MASLPGRADVGGGSDSDEWEPIQELVPLKVTFGQQWENGCPRYCDVSTSTSTETPNFEREGCYWGPDYNATSRCKNETMGACLQLLKTAMAENEPDNLHEATWE